MGNPSPKPRAESSRQYDRLVKGEISSKQYVKTLRKEARTHVAAKRSTGRRRVA